VTIQQQLEIKTKIKSHKLLGYKNLYLLGYKIYQTEMFTKLSSSLSQQRQRKKKKASR